MKKVASSVVSILMVLVLAVGMTACSGVDPKLQEYIDSDEFQSELQQMNDGLTDVGKVAVTAEDKTMVMTFDIDVTMKSFAKESIAMDPNSITAQFQEVANELAEEVDLPDVSLKLVVTSGGENLYEEVLKAE